jgi:hypothetical protein
VAESEEGRTQRTGPIVGRLLNGDNRVVELLSSFSRELLELVNTLGVDV